MKVQNYPWLDQVNTEVSQRIEQDRLAHALLIDGQQGIGKLDFAESLAARLLCLNPNTEACGECRSCQLLAGGETFGGAHPDLHLIYPEEGSDTIKVDQVRQLIQDMTLTTTISPRTIAVLCPAESMNISAANALLKTLEEPPGDGLLILVSHDSLRLPITIRSRCQRLAVSTPSKDQAAEWLSAQADSDIHQAEHALHATAGSPLNALNYLQEDQGELKHNLEQSLAALIMKGVKPNTVLKSLADMDSETLWRWLSLSSADLLKAQLSHTRLEWCPVDQGVNLTALSELQKLADKNRRLSHGGLRQDLLILDWLIQWSTLKAA